MKRVGLLLTVLASCVLATSVTTAADVSSPGCKKDVDAYCFAPTITALSSRLDSASLPKIATPSWMGMPAAPAARTVTYTVATKGTVKADVGEFTAQVAETLNSPLGWSRLGVRFERVESGGQFTVWLSEGSQVPSFSPGGCDAVVSCTVGNNVIINEIRWLNGSDAWNGAGGSLRDYRHMVLNHETGHWLGHGHQYCSEAGQLAPVMQQQTIDMQGCKPNPWPQQSEMYSPKLGIRS